jgi:periplasmic divalent cation tolerance protein
MAWRVWSSIRPLPRAAKQYNKRRQKYKGDREEIVTDLLIVLTTITDRRAAELARTLVDEHLAACVNVLGPMTSTYRWNGRLEQEIEHQVFIKTTATRLAEVESRLRQLHSYELPEFIVLKPEAASAAYAAWVRAETQEA